MHVWVEFYATFEDEKLSAAMELCKIGPRSRDDWMKVFDALPDACVTPVLELDEAPLHPQNVARKAFVVNQKGKHEPVSQRPILNFAPRDKLHPQW
jgi:crotonobetainyl-CoA:carnitine CoA-transferase CaiB-like acyl-CoA transferase